MKWSKERKIDGYKVALSGARHGMSQKEKQEKHRINKSHVRLRSRSTKHEKEEEWKGKGRSGKTRYDGCVHMDVPGALLVDESGRGLLELERELEDTEEAKLLEDPPV